MSMTPTHDVRLAGTWFGRRLSQPVRERLAGLAGVRRFEPGVVILWEGEAVSHLGVVLAGRVGLRDRIPERGFVTMMTVEPGDIYGWSALVSPYRSTSTAVAVDEVEALAFEAELLREALRTDEALAAALYPAVLAAVARRLGATRLQLADLFGQNEVQPW